MFYTWCFTGYRHIKVILVASREAFPAMCTYQNSVRIKEKSKTIGGTRRFIPEQMLQTQYSQYKPYKRYTMRNNLRNNPTACRRS